MTGHTSARRAQWLRRALPFLLFALGVLVRVWRFGAVPSGLNQDEAFSGYEAWSLLHDGIDSNGYPFPVYLAAWGSGMNALQSYLILPFAAVLGLTETAVRLPQLLLGCATMPVLYRLLRDAFDRRTALVGLALLAISPWHIMLSRWALESNLAPFFLLAGFSLLCGGLRDPRRWAAAALVYGVGLYAYAITWVAVPLTLLLFCLCVLLLRPAALRTRWLAVSVGILFALALPLILFYLVNHGLLPEIVTPFFSIPRMPSLRSVGVSLRNVFRARTWRGLYALFIEQNDGLLWNTTRFGLFYHLTLPFLFLGLGRMLLRAGRALRARRLTGDLLLLLPLIAGLFTAALLSDANTNRTNCVPLFLLVPIAVGVETLFHLPGRLSVLMPALAGAAAVLCLGAFGRYYFHDYDRQLAPTFQAGLGAAVRYLQACELEDVWVDNDIQYPRILFYEQVPAPQFLATVRWRGGRQAFSATESFTRFTFGAPDETPGAHAAYLFPADRREAVLAGRDCTVTTFDTVCVAIPS